jgi:hypothetical protein
MDTQCLDLDLHRSDLRFAGARIAEPRRSLVSWRGPKVVRSQRSKKRLLVRELVQGLRLWQHEVTAPGAEDAGPVCRRP